MRKIPCAGLWRPQAVKHLKRSSLAVVLIHSIATSFTAGLSVVRELRMSQDVYARDSCLAAWIRPVR